MGSIRFSNLRDAWSRCPRPALGIAVALALALLGFVGIVVRTRTLRPFETNSRMGAVTRNPGASTTSSLSSSRTSGTVVNGKESNLPNHPGSSRVSGTAYYSLDIPLTPVNPALVSFHPTLDLLMRGLKNPSKVALTFDAGNDARAVPLILKTLGERHLHATFFLTGQFCEKYPRACRAISDAGMELGNHSYSHPHFTHISDSKIVDELERAELAIVKACGRGARPLFRFPYGDSNRHTQKIVASAGFQPIHWSLDSLDAYGRQKSADFVASRIDSRLKPGAITLMHVSCVSSARALPRILDQLTRMHAQQVPVSDLLLAASLPVNLTIPHLENAGSR